MVSSVPDISHLSDAIRLMDGTRFIDTKVAAVEATVYRSKDVVASANRELERHQQWFECHRELYAEDLKRAERQLSRLGVLRSCKQTVIFPMRLAASAGVTLLHAAQGALTNRAKHKQLRPPFQKNDKAVNPGSTPSPSFNFPNVRYGSLADSRAGIRDVRFTPKSGHAQSR